IRTPGNEGQASSVTRRCRRHYQKSPSVVALSRVPRGERGAPVRLRLPVAGARKRDLFLRRLSGLLSGCPPTDTRPQARAKLGNSEIGHLFRARKTSVAAPLLNG